jgi:hypothetical protein
MIGFFLFLKIKNGERKWITLKDRKCILPVKGIIEIEATLIYTNVNICFCSNKFFMISL